MFYSMFFYIILKTRKELQMFYIIVLVEFDIDSRWIPLRMHYYHDGFELIKCHALDEVNPYDIYENALNAAKELSESDSHNVYGVFKGNISDDNVIFPEEMSDDAYYMGEIVAWMDYV